MVCCVKETQECISSFTNLKLFLIVLLNNIITTSEQLPSIVQLLVRVAQELIGTRYNNQKQVHCCKTLLVVEAAASFINYE